MKLDEGSMVFEVKKRKYVFSPRIAEDVLNLAESKAIKADILSGFLVHATILCDSLKSTYRLIPWYSFLRRFQYRKFKKHKRGTYYILKNTRVDELIKMADYIVVDLEQGKKKALTTENKNQ